MHASTWMLLISSPVKTIAKNKNLDHDVSKSKWWVMYSKPSEMVYTVSVKSQQQPTNMDSTPWISFKSLHNCQYSNVCMKCGIFHVLPNYKIKVKYCSPIMEIRAFPLTIH